MLDTYRVLDLTDERGFLCGKILGDLGADVIKVERPGGDPARRIGPFYHDIPDPEKSLNWFAFNGSKRGVTLNIEDSGGKDIFLKLVNNADIIIESSSPGYMDGLGLGYGTLSERNPRLIMTSITPFGQTGPYKDRKASDIDLLAMSGLISLTGDPDRPPLKMCLEQSYYFGSTHAAVGTLMALQFRHASGEGQHVDVSIYETLVRLNYREPFRWEFEKAMTSRAGNIFTRGDPGQRMLWPCKDGYISWGFVPDKGQISSFVNWMKEEGMAGSWGKVAWDETVIEDIDKEELIKLQEAIVSFISTRTSQELETAALERRIRISPVNTVDFLEKDEQLISRGFWKSVEHPELDTEITYPGFTYLASEGENEIRFRAPLIGEHNSEFYGEELGLSEENITSLKERGII
ncbi:CaiB/BaiF CoA transferase family protein [Thermodesulfobacteriota bacterium]